MDISFTTTPKLFKFCVCVPDIGMEGSMSQFVTLSAKSSLILGENKPGFHSEGHICCI